MAVLVDRSYGLALLRRWRDRPLIKVVTGVRRCGKSTLLELFRRELLAEGIPPDQIVAMNLESPDDARLAPSHLALYDHVVSRLNPNGTTYVFIDEVQLIEGFEKAINGLNLLDQVDVYVTGSNASLLSGELATLLSGRSVEIPLSPFSFGEYLAGRRQRDPATSPDRAFLDFSRSGSFPLTVSLLPDVDAISDYLDGVLNTVLIKDVMVRQGVRDAQALRDVTAFFLENVGNQTSLRRVVNTLESAGRKPSPNTVERYLTGLLDAFILYPLRAYDTKGLRHLDTPAKYYAVDPGLRAAVTRRPSDDVGHVLENIVFLELRRRYRNLWMTRSGGGEIDFVASDETGFTYFQVAATVREQATRERELAPLLAVKDHSPKWLLTLDPDPPMAHEGIQQRYVVDWLLEG